MAVLRTPFEFRGMGRVPASRSWHLGWQTHPFNELIVVTGGRFAVGTRHGECEGVLGLGTGDVVVYPAGCLHEETSDPDEPVETLFFTFDGPSGDRVRSVRDSEARIRSLARWLWDSGASTYAGAANLRQVWFAALMEEFCRLDTPLSAEGSLVEKARGYMRAHLGESVALEHLASHCALSKYHFLRLYRTASGRTPMADLRQMRLEEAVALLRTTSLPLKAVAPMVGMLSEFHLSRALRRYLGRTAGMIRQGKAC